MNKTRRILLPLVIVLILGLAVVLPSQGKPGGFIINNADGTAELSFQPSSGLLTLLNQVRPRLVVDYGDGTQKQALLPPPAALQELLSTMKDKISVQFAKGNATFPLQAVPATLSGQLAEIKPRITFEFANANHAAELHFPQQMIGDNARPTVSSIATGTQPDGRFAITWKTDEFADSMAEIGTSSGSYTTTISDPLFVKDHVLFPTALQPGAKYYFRVTSTDRSDNTVRSQESTFIFVERQLLYLPYIKGK